MRCRSVGKRTCFGRHARCRGIRPGRGGGTRVPPGLTATCVRPPGRSGRGRVRGRVRRPRALGAAQRRGYRRPQARSPGRCGVRGSRSPWRTSHRRPRQVTTFGPCVVSTPRAPLPCWFHLKHGWSSRQRPRFGVRGGSGGAEGGDDGGDGDGSGHAPVIGGEGRTLKAAARPADTCGAGHTTPHRRTPP
jgi:hypothetical protein